MAGPTSSYDRGYQTEVASGYAGTPVARRQGPLDALKEAFGSVGDYFSRGWESGLGNVDIGSGLGNIRATDPRAGVGNIQQAIAGFEPAKFAEAGSALLSPAYATYLKTQGQAPSGSTIFDGLFPSSGPDPSKGPGHVGTTVINGGLQGAIDTIRDSGTSNSDYAAQDSLLKTAYARRQEEFYAGLNSIQSQITGDYQDRIGGLTDELGKYRGGLTDVNSAYSDYADDANAILAGAAAGVEGEAIPDSAVVEVVGENFDKYDGEVQAALQRIDSSGNTELAKAMAGEVRYMEETIADGLRSGLASQSDLHNLATAEAQALAHMSWKDDAYEGERSRFMLEMQINQQIQNKQDEIAAAKDAMDKALRDAKANYGEFTLSPDELWGEAMNDYFSSSGLNLQEQQEMRGLWEAVMQNPQAMVNYDTFKASVMQAANEHNLAIVGALDDYDRIVEGLTQQARSDDPATAERGAGVLNQIRNAMQQPLSVATLKALTTAASNFGIDLGGLADIDLDTVPWDDLEDSASLKYQKMLDLWGHHNDYRNNYEQYITTQAGTYPTSGGSQAPNNAANKDQPAYAYRRDVTAPWFADQIKATFPSLGVKIGGLGYIRPPGTGVDNSDHQSGGAIDVYASTEQGRKAIANWARSQPGVSLVIYEGNSAHEGHHVHISFQIGFTPSGMAAAPTTSYASPASNPPAPATSLPPQPNPYGQGGPY